MTSKIIHTCFSNFKSQSPLIHNITNEVANNAVANVLLATGASPAMVVDINEAPEFVCIANALALNIGTLTQNTLQSMLATAEAAYNNHIPWLLDPVAVGSSNFRLNACQQLLKYKPTVIRGNASEILSLAGMSSKAKGIDSGDSVDSSLKAAHSLTQFASIVVVTGEVDYVTNGTHSWSIHHGNEIMTKVTALGCALSALIAGFVSANPNTVAEAAATSLAYYGIAGEIAAQSTNGPGSFYVEFLDTLYNLDVSTIAKTAKIKKHSRV